MKKKFVHRFVSAFAAAVIGVGAVCMFAGCTSDNPEVRISYSFNGQTYDVDYTLTRLEAPQTTQHFIELADAGFYDGTVIHDYDSTALYGGGYTIENGMLAEKDYFTFAKEYEKSHSPFTQTVFKEDKKTPLYTVVGEFDANFRTTTGTDQYRHSKGALVMYYHDCGENFRYTVALERADGGADNDGNKWDERAYRENSATSLFYTFLGASNSSLDEKYAVFGKTKDYDGQMQPLLDAIDDYSSELPEDKTFTTAYEDFPDRLYLFLLTQGEDEEFDSLRRSGIEADFDTPIDMPIYVTSVKVTKY